MIFYLHRDVSRLWPGSQGKSGLTSIHSVFLWTWPLFFSIFFFFTLIQDFSIKIVFTCCNSISYSTDRATFTFSRGKSSRLYRISDCVSSSFVNGMNSSYFFFFFSLSRWNFIFNLTPGREIRRKKIMPLFVPSIRIFLSIVRLHPPPLQVFKFNSYPHRVRSLKEREISF